MATGTFQIPAQTWTQLATAAATGDAVIANDCIISDGVSYLYIGASAPVSVDGIILRPQSNVVIPVQLADKIYVWSPNGGVYSYTDTAFTPSNLQLLYNGFPYPSAGVSKVMTGVNTISGGNLSSYTLSGVYSGTGSLVCNQSANLQFSGTNTMTGGFVANVNTVSVAGSFRNATSITVGSSANLIIIAGAGAAYNKLAKTSWVLQSGGKIYNNQGNGTICQDLPKYVNMSANSAISNSVSSDDPLGYYQALSGADACTIKVEGANCNLESVTTLTGNLTIDINPDCDLTIGINFVGSGGIIKNGEGYLSLDGTKSYTGDTVVNAGYLYPSSEASGNYVVNGGRLIAYGEIQNLTFEAEGILQVEDPNTPMVCLDITADNGFTVDFPYAVDEGTYTLISSAGILPSELPTVGINNTGFDTIEFEWDGGLKVTISA